MRNRLRTAPRKAPRQDRSKATVEAILLATVRVLVRDGYDRASTNRIAQAAGVSIGSLYQYFPSKEALVAAVIERHTERVCQQFMQKMAEVADQPMPVVIRELVQGLIRAKLVEPRLHKVLMEQVPRVGRLGRVREMEARVGELVRGFLQARRPELRPADVDAAAFTVVTVGIALSHAIAIERPEELSEPRLVEAFNDLVSSYLLTPAPARVPAAPRASTSAGMFVSAAVR